MSTLKKERKKKVDTSTFSLEVKVPKMVLCDLEIVPYMLLFPKKKVPDVVGVKFVAI